MKRERARKRENKKKLQELDHFLLLLHLYVISRLIKRYRERREISPPDRILCGDAKSSALTIDLLKNALCNRGIREWIPLNFVGS